MAIGLDRLSEMLPNELLVAKSTDDGVVRKGDNPCPVSAEERCAQQLEFEESDSDHSFFRREENSQRNAHCNVL